MNLMLNECPRMTAATKEGRAIEEGYILEAELAQLRTTFSTFQVEAQLRINELERAQFASPV